MLLSYWDCKYQEYDEVWAEDHGCIRIYGCTHPNNKNKFCDLDNKWYTDKDDCTLLDEEK